MIGVLVCECWVTNVLVGMWMLGDRCVGVWMLGDECVGGHVDVG